MLFWPHRAVPLERTVVLRDRQGVVPFRYDVGPPDQYIFTADVHGYRVHQHPERHLGWWRFELPEGAGRAALHCDFRQIARESVRLEVDGRMVPPLDGWHNPAYAFEPLGDLELVFRDERGGIRRQEPVLLKFVDRDILSAFYARHYATQGYEVPIDRPFLRELHAYKMRVLQRLFQTHIPAGGRVADVGCGRSLFSDMPVPFAFRVFAGDLDHASVRDRAREVPQQAWAVFDAAALPFADGRFDALFAGEVIEHVPDARATIREWRRVLRPGGVLIVTTPNRERLVARAGGREQPYSPDHLSELSYRELTGELLPEAGFELVTQSCAYLELWLRNLFNGRTVEDYLQREGNVPRYRWLMRALFPLGRLLPAASLSMVVVARRRAGT